MLFLYNICMIAVYIPSNDLCLVAMFNSSTIVAVPSGSSSAEAFSNRSATTCKLEDALAMENIRSWSSGLFGFWFTKSVVYDWLRVKRIPRIKRLACTGRMRGSSRLPLGPHSPIPTSSTKKAAGLRNQHRLPLHIYILLGQQHSMRGTGL